MTSKPREALREKVARAIYEGTGGTKWDILEEEGTKEDYRIEADAAIDVVLEEAARQFDEMLSSSTRPSAAAAIRAMKGKD
jgi:hypothetical protein